MEKIKSIELIGGVNKLGEREQVLLELKPGEIVAIVGPTGSGKSRLLEDIEWLANADTPTMRRILINGKIPTPELKYAADSKLIAQLSQNMNFVMDANVRDFIRMHALSRQVQDCENVIRRIITKANTLAGESFSGDTPITALSGGQSRALMIADTAFLSNSPIILIDEIENAGIDRRRALELLVRKEKIILIATHDPILALMASKRIVIKNGGITKIIQSSRKERESLVMLEKLDKKLLSIRNRLRLGEEICLTKEVYGNGTEEFRYDGIDAMSFEGTL